MEKLENNEYNIRKDAAKSLNTPTETFVKSAKDDYSTLRGDIAERYCRKSQHTS